MRRGARNSGNFQEERQTKRMVYITLGVLLVAILAFVITFLIYSNAFSSEPQIGDITTMPISNLVGKNEASEQASSSIGKTVNEVAGLNEEPTKIAVNTSNMVKENVTTNTVTNTTANNKTNQTNSNSTKQPETPKKEEKVEDPKFIKPVEGEITKEFAKDNLVYSETLQEWVTHTGIDIKADKATIVKVAADGTVKSIKNDPRFGITVVVDHVNGFQTIYSNLLTAEFVKEGEKLTSGQTLGTVGNTATFEIIEEPHLHFEIVKNGEQVDPNLYLK